MKTNYEIRYAAHPEDAKSYDTKRIRRDFLIEKVLQHVIFILATTEKHKILPTILSRCQIYDFERMTVANTINGYCGRRRDTE